ncbi:hypothetical protein NUW58_g2806 [Xylaria curta]|uniref:Uncharacterized protein n=1 Tax=Xylaria curta TaxID=42375 RepID=A0ACC1PF61_9PEZI|nr:hypothetical protein NUW58_g2806 [Xylaria curta]
MPYKAYRVYIRFGESNCVRFFAPGNGSVAENGIQLFKWIRDPHNISRLRNGLQHVYETDQEELRYFLEYKLQEDRGYMKDQMNKYPEGGEMLAAFSKRHVQFGSLPTGIDKLDAIANATEITVIPRASPRKRSDQPGWLYLLDLNQETLEVYEFKDHKPRRYPPFARLTIKSLYRESPDTPQGYYIKLKFSDLQGMLQSEWVELHEAHAQALGRLWRRNATILQTIPHADSIPFSVLYGSVFYGQDRNRLDLGRPRRLTQAGLTAALAALNRRQPSKMPIFESEASTQGGVVDRRLRALRRRVIGHKGHGMSDRQRKRIYGI